MNKIIKNFSIKRISRENISSFQNLVKNHCPKKKHIFCKNKDLINFYYNYNNKKKTNLIGLYKKDKLIATMGLIPNKNWDKKLKEDYFLAFTLKSRSADHPMFNFLDYIYNKIKPKFLAASGIHLGTAGKILERLCEIKLFSHYYIRNPILTPKISKNLISSKKRLHSNNPIELNLKITNKITKLPRSNYCPIKSKIYYTKKYLENFYHKYFVMNFYSEHKLEFFFICRKIEIEKYNIKILRIIDFHGILPARGCLVNAITNYLIDNNIEYIDILCHGFRDHILENVGFLKKTTKQKIPDHFAPYTGKDANLNFCILINKYKKNIILLKGDGDQDRPSLI
jgi:hypothetical protein